jgi:DNA-directed RNA polymerase specialized sigma24 family protein
MNQEPTSSWVEAWELFTHQRDSLASVLKGMQGFGLSGEDAEDLLHSFVLQRLPRIATRTEALSAEERSRYLRASFRNFVRDAQRARKRQDAALERLAIELRDDSDDNSDVTPALSVQSVLSQLPKNSARALSMFLGLGTSPMSVREIANALRTSRYAAKLLVLDGLIGGALALGEGGILSEVETEACREVILNASSIERAATSLGLTAEQVKRALQRARKTANATLAGHEGGRES